MEDGAPVPADGGNAHPSGERLLARTGDFFERHWNVEALGAPPAWQAWETFLDGSVPNHQYGGCYAIFAGHELIYVGLGASRGGGRYPEHGISRRLMAHVLRSDRRKSPYGSRLIEAWAEATAIWTIGFASCGYLAPALESFLIRELAPRRNGRV